MKGVVRELEKRLLQAASAAERLETLLELGGHHAAAFRNREGLRAACEALEIARDRDERLALGRALSIATLCHYQRGDYVSAVASGLDAVEAYAEGDLLGRSSALQSIALALFAVEQFELAQTTADRAVADARAGGDAAREAAARTVHGMILAGRGRYRAARRQFRIAGALYRRLGERLEIKKSAIHVADTYRGQGNAAAMAGSDAQARLQWRHALRVYRVALAAGESDADDAIILGSIAECECRLGDIDAAYEDASRALDRAPGASARIVAACRLWQSHALQAMVRLEAAERACAQAVAAAADVEHDAMLATCLHAQARLHDLMGRFESAADLEERARRIAHHRCEVLARVREEMAPLWDRYTAEPRNVVRIDSRA